MHGLKKGIQNALERNDLSLVAASVVKGRKVLSMLVRLSYEKETLVGWRAILAVGMAARELVKTEPEFLRDACRKLLWSLNDESGGIGWSAPELLGEIVSADTKRFADLIPLIAEAYDIEGGMFRAGVVYALTRIGAHAPEKAASFRRIIDDALAARDPLVRIRGLELAGSVSLAADRSSLWPKEYYASLKGRIKEMTQDKGEAWIYGEDGFSSVQVGDRASDINKMF